MTASHLLESQDVLIFGLGLMGGSLSLALRGNCRSVTAVEIDERTRQLAINLQIVEHIFPYPPPRPIPASLVILAAPIHTNLRILDNLGDYCSGPAVVMDLGSTKTSTVQKMEMLSDVFIPIGGHPMCGKEKSSLEHADGDLYREAVFALTPLTRTTPTVRKLARELVVTVGAVPLWIDARTHDAWVSYTSHLPYLLANALAHTVPQAARPLVGPGLTSTTRLAGSNLTMMMDILVSNRDNILAALAASESNLQQVHELLEEQRWDELRLLLQSGADRRAFLIPD